MSIPTPPPSPPGRRPYGTVLLAAPVDAGPAARTGTGTARRPGRWFGPKVTLPPLSVDALRRTDPASGGRART